ncbi:hypothetical protein [Collinsella sp. HCP28S3_B9]|uniref:hypothetical protein n=1 Tax=Collinsella sp. HCP28S3_B9 TaxID=3438920 RepID=UPI003F8C5822
MITYEKKHEVAQKLCALDMSDIEVDGCIIDSPKYVGLLLMRMLDAACDYRDGLHYFPGFFSAQAVVELFADLIDRPTCEMTECSIDHGSRSWGMRCSRCGTEFEHEKPVYGWRYCPNCGAEVEDEV